MPLGSKSTVMGGDAAKLDRCDRDSDATAAKSTTTRRIIMVSAVVTTTQDSLHDQPDLKAIKIRQQGAWSSGDYAVIGTTLQIVGEELCEALDLRSNQTVLDVAAGNGNASLAAARRWCDVVATDYVPTLLERARERAGADRLNIEFREADAEALPFADGSFDVVVSTFGVMFTPDQDRAAAELVRVCKKGGKIGLANWTPDGFIGQLFKTIGKHVPPPTGARSPALWGMRPRLAELFESHAGSIQSASRHFVFRYRSAEHWLETFKTYYGPVLRTFAALAPPAQAQLQHDLVSLIGRLNRSEDGSMVVPSEYLEVVITRR
jgi:ubiquinone/menaquinone biosynthesis C-methylase UbiE